MKLLLITFILIGLGITGIAIKLWAKKEVSLPEPVRAKTLCSIKMENHAVCVEKLPISLKTVMNLNVPNIECPSIKNSKL